LKVVVQAAMGAQTIVAVVTFAWWVAIRMATAKVIAPNAVAKNTRRPPVVKGAGAANQILKNERPSSGGRRGPQRD